jgi:hypothetical protein
LAVRANTAATLSPGRTYIVGERHPEFFVTRQPGQVGTSPEIGGRPQVRENHFRIHGVQNFDSFKRRPN